MNGSRGGYARGRAPARPGNLTGQKYGADSQRAEAERRLAKQSPESAQEARKAAYMDGWGVGFDAGYEAAIRALEALDEPGEVAE